MTKIIATTLALTLVGLMIGLWFRGGRVIVLLPDGTAAEGAKVWVSYHSADALLAGVTDGSGGMVISAKTMRRRGWDSIIASWEDQGGTKYVGHAEDDDSSFPLTIRISKR